MKMTSDSGNGDNTASTEKVSSNKNSPSATVPAARSEVKHRLTTFSIDSLVGKSEKNDPDSQRPSQVKSAFGGIPDDSIDFPNRRGSSRSPSPGAKRLRVQQPESPRHMQQNYPKMTVLSKTPPANGLELSELQQNPQAFARQSAFMPPPVSSGPSASNFAAPGLVSGGRLCWDLASVEPAAGLWKDAVAASAMYQAAAAAALYGGYPWYAPPTSMAPGDAAKNQQILLQQEQASVAMMASPPQSVSRSDAHRHLQQNHNQMASAADQQQTFWHHHIAELLRTNGGHPVHHSRLYAGPDAGHAAGFLFSSCRKPKRIRTAFSPNQLMELEAAFEKNQYVVGNERKDLARRLALTETQVKVWFQNRRTKAKRMKNEDNAGTPGAASSSSSASSAPSASTKTTTAAIPYQNDKTEEAGNGQSLPTGDNFDKASHESKSAREEIDCRNLSDSPAADEIQIENDEEINETEYHSSDDDAN